MSSMQQEKWYLRFHGEAVGPFPSFQIARYLLLKRLQTDDEISRDKLKWYPIIEVKEVWPEKRLAAAGIDEAEREGLEATRRWVEEHATLFLPQDEAHGVEEELLFEDEVYHPRHQGGTPVRRITGYLLALLLAAVAVAVPFMLPEGDAPDTPRCDDAPAMGVNWSNCRMDGARLENADLREAVLRNINLNNAVLRAANLAGSDLAYADLSLANLRAANLAGANLSGANLRNADLQSSDLSGANLTYADLSGASLKGATFEGAQFGYAVLGDDTLCMPESVGRCIPGRR